MRKRPRDRIAQNEDEFHRRVVVRDPFGRRRPVHVRRRDFAEQALRRPRVEGAMVDRVVDRLDREEPIPIEEMQFFARLRHADLRMLSQKRIECRSAALLRPADDEINTHVLATD